MKGPQPQFLRWSLSLCWERPQAGCRNRQPMPAPLGCEVKERRPGPAQPALTVAPAILSAAMPLAPRLLVAMQPVLVLLAPRQPHQLRLIGVPNR